MYLRLSILHFVLYVSFIARYVVCFMENIRGVCHECLFEHGLGYEIGPMSMYICVFV